ncbi:MAG: hypothetical protein JSW53_04000 [Candidatus Bathyarchaeota archaeon]|nr:MAG: hypothetical protein JSW53_04000 [Candidatus Bathyarchaeota archaeon]
MAQILSIAREGTLKTQIMYRANLSFAQLNEYLSLLQEVKLLRVNSEDGRTTYRTTTKGMKYLENFSIINSLLKRAHEDNPKGKHSNQPTYFLY